MKNLILNNQKRFDNLYSENKNVEMIKVFNNTYIVIFYNKLSLVSFSINGWNLKTLKS